MKVYMCQVHDGDGGELVTVGAFSTLAKAMEAGSLFIIASNHGEVTLLDWDHDGVVYTDWYSNCYTRIITVCEVDRRLA